jgi:hypothetical protein
MPLKGRALGGGSIKRYEAYAMKRKCGKIFHLSDIALH